MGSNSKDKRDIYYRMAKKLGYRARSAFKLLHIDEHYNILTKATNIVDLCSAPGGWTQVLKEKNPDANIISIDLQKILPIPGITFLQEDITSEECKNKVLALIDACDLLVCDGAPDVTGIHDIDEYHQCELLLSALNIFIKIARVGCNFVGKCFRSEDTGYLLRHFNNYFDDVEICKPKSSRINSIECFIVCFGYNGCKNDPFDFDVSVEPLELILKTVGNGPSADLSQDNGEHIKTEINPIEPPYKKAIEIRRHNGHANK